MALTQASPSAPAQVQMFPAGVTTAQVIQQKLLQAAAASSQIQSPPANSPAPQATAPPAADAPAQQPAAPAKGQARSGGALRAKTPAKPSGGGS